MVFMWVLGRGGGCTLLLHHLPDVKLTLGVTSALSGGWRRVEVRDY